GGQSVLRWVQIGAAVPVRLAQPAGDRRQHARAAGMIRFERLIAIRLVSHDAAALASFYSAALGFERGPVTPVAAEELAALGLAGTGTRTSLTLSGQVLEIDQFDPPGQPYP